MAAEKKRGCGYRKIGGTYLMSDGPGFPCGRFPIPLLACPLCDHRPSFTRGLQRITPKNVLHSAPICATPLACGRCPFQKALETETAGLMWVGDRFYTPATFLAEAAEQGVSKRIPQVPKWLEVGRTWVFLAHEAGITKVCTACEGKGLIPVHNPAPVTLGDVLPLVCEPCEGTGELRTPAVFQAFVPSRVERIIPDTMPEEERAKLRKQGLTLIEVPADDPDHQPPAKGQKGRREDEEE